MNTFSKVLFILFSVVFIACDDDYNTIGADLIDVENFEYDKYIVSNLNSYTFGTDAVQTNNLPINAIGIFKNEAFGTSKAHIVSQVKLNNVNPAIGLNHSIATNDSVYIYIPFFSTVLSTDASGNRTFELDSVHGDLSKKFKFRVFENKYYLSDFDPNDNFETAQKYYSDFKPTIDAVRDNFQLNNDSNTAENEQFFFNDDEILIYKTDANGNKLNSNNVITSNPSEFVVKTRKTPGIWINLDKTKIKERILDAVDDGKLENNNIFKEYFRGLLFEVEEIQPGDGAMAKFDLSKAEFVIQYHSFDEDENGQPTGSSIKRSMNLSLGDNTVNLFEFSNINSNYQNAITNNSTDKLFLKGGANGSVVYIDAFGPDLMGSSTGGPNGVADELDELRKKGWLINEANLTFYIDQTTMDLVDEKNTPLRIYLFDATNDKVLVDYILDPTFFSNNKIDKSIFGGIISRESVDGTNKFVKYKIRITNYINNLLNEELSETNSNIRFGLVVSESINISANYYLKNPLNVNGQTISKIPAASIMNPLGTVLYGTGSIDLEKKLKLEINYTKPN